MDVTLAGVRTLPLGRLDGLKRKPSLTSVNSPELSLTKKLAFLELIDENLCHVQLFPCWNINSAIF
jgi:hypothetical protein